MDLILLEITFVYTLIHISVVVSQSCTFYKGATTLVRSCSSGCCDSGCCTDDYKTLAIILGTVFGCLVLTIIIVIVVVCLTKERWSKRVNPKSKDNAKKKNDDVVLTDMKSNNTMFA